MDILLVVNVQYHCNHFNMAFKNKVSIHTFLYRFKFVQWRERKREREREKKKEEWEREEGTDGWTISCHCAISLQPF